MSRKYEATHPWLKFSIDLARASPAFWMALGEAQSKRQHIAGVPLKPAVAEELQKLYLAKGVFATTAIEGNTLSEDEVRQRLEGNLQLPPSKEYLGREIDNMLAACNSLERAVIETKDDGSFTTPEICNYNRLILQGLPLPNEVTPGSIREHSVEVARYRGAPAEDCAYLLDQFCVWLNTGFTPPQGQEIVYGVIKAVLAHLYLAWIHPFGDGNGRTARLLEIKILLAAGVPRAANHLLSNHYNQTRAEYYRQLDQASRNGGDVLPFLDYAVRGFVDGLREQLKMIKSEQWQLAWENYVHECFRDKNSKANIRQRYLLLDLSFKNRPVPPSEIPELSTRLASAYSGKHRKTIMRDLNTLVEMGLVTAVNDGYRARKELILAFLPQSISGRAT